MNGRFDSAEPPVTFDRYVLNFAERGLLRDGEPVALTPKAYAILAILVAHRGAAVSREQLFDVLWPEGLVEDGNLTQNIYMLRRILDRGRNGRRFIETVPRHGYRFAMPVRSIPQRGAVLGRPVTAARFARAALAVVLACVTLAVSSGAPRPCVPSLDPVASLSYSLGLYHWNMRTPVELTRSIAYFKKTIRFAPSSALGYAGVAGAYAIEAQDTDDGSAAAARYVRLAERYRDAALRRDPNSPEALTIAGFIAGTFHSDYASANRDYARAIALKPNYATAHHWNAVLHFAQGDIGGALHEWEVAHQLEPTSEVISRWLGIGYVYARRPIDAIHILSETLTLQPDDHEAWLQLAAAQEQEGRLHDALTTLEALKHRDPAKRPYVTVMEARVKAISRHGAVDAPTIAQVVRLAVAKRVHTYDVVYFFAALGQKERALAMLSRARPTTELDRSMEKNDPRLALLRSDARFVELLR
ncbi:MAG: winged helix-turn-helix domain-containing protein [Vulcanimicrobiaceae bacterium]